MIPVTLDALNKYEYTYGESIYIINFHFIAQNCGNTVGKKCNDNVYSHVIVLFYKLFFYVCRAQTSQWRLFVSVSSVSSCSDESEKGLAFLSSLRFVSQKVTPITDKINSMMAAEQS